MQEVREGSEGGASVIRVRFTSPLLDGLSRRAWGFLQAHGVRVPVADLRPGRDRWLQSGVPDEEIERVLRFQDRWGGAALPPAPEYEGGPLILSAGLPERDVGGWWFPAGGQRCSMAYGFSIGPGGEFGIRAKEWTPLHASIEGWVESLALAHDAARWAETVTKVRGEGVDAIDLNGFELVPEVQGLADSWWRGDDSLIAFYRGEADFFATPQYRVAYIYGGLEEWVLTGD